MKLRDLLKEELKVISKSRNGNRIVVNKKDENFENDITKVAGVMRSHWEVRQTPNGYSYRFEGDAEWEEVLTMLGVFKDIRGKYKNKKLKWR